ncbi:unnamed protein product [Mucor hiemalis]
MIQTLDLPVLSLAIPNIHKLNDINTDNLSCMWTVFSKCKDNLENGRRLENMSWRLWYRESSLKESIHNNNRTQLSSTCPIPIHKTNNTLIESKSLAEKQLSTASFKRIISSVNENEAILPPTTQKEGTNSKPEMIMFQQPQNQQQQQEQKQQQQVSQNKKCESNKFFISKDEESDVEYEDEEGWLSEDEEIEEVLTTPPINNIKPITKKFMISDDEEDEDGYEDINDDYDESAFLSEFRKRSPINVITKQGCSLLSNMLRRAQHDTRLASQPITVVQNQEPQTKMEIDELSVSMRKCVEWEQHGYQHDFILDSNVKHNTFITADDGFRSYW